MKRQRGGNSNDRKRLTGFRLEIAIETLRYLIDTKAANLDISTVDEIGELCDEYALRALCIWLATKYGCAVCTCAICSGTRNGAAALEGCLQQYGEYPFGFETSCDFNRVLLEVAQRNLEGAVSLSLGLLGTLYELVLNQRLYIDRENGESVRIDIQNKENRRTIGQFYTPPSVVKHCLDIAMHQDSAALMKRLKCAVSGSGQSRNDFKVLDPSCGTGNFLWGVLEYLDCLNGTAGAGWSTALHSFAASSLFGVELDPRACSLARVSICIYMLQHGRKGVCAAESVGQMLAQLRRNIRVSDTIFLAAGSVETGESFDLVITNPPYVSFGARNQPTLPHSSSCFLKRFYPESAEYKVRYHSIFQEIALRYAGDGGSAVLLVPDGFLTGSYYEKLRAKLIATARIASLTELKEDTIAEAVVGRWCVAHYIKGTTEAHQRVQVQTYCQEKEAPPITYSLPLSVFVAPDRKRFRLIFNDLDSRLIETADRCQKLSALLRGHTGIRSKLGKDAVVSKACRGGSWRRGITSGAEVLPYRVDWKGGWINVDASILFGGGFDRQIVESPKVLIRQTGDRIIAAVDSTGLYHLNNVHSFAPHKDCRERISSLELLYLCGLSNSKLWQHLYRLKTREEGRALAQVDIETVETMPMPEFDSGAVDQIADLVKGAGSADNDLIFFIRQRIDALVYSLYGLDDDTIRHIERCQTRGKEQNNESRKIEATGSLAI